MVKGKSEKKESNLQKLSSEQSQESIHPPTHRFFSLVPLLFLSFHFAVVACGPILCFAFVFFNLSLSLSLSNGFIFYHLLASHPSQSHYHRPFFFFFPRLPSPFSLRFTHAPPTPSPSNSSCFAQDSIFAQRNQRFFLFFPLCASGVFLF